MQSTLTGSGEALDSDSIPAIAKVPAGFPMADLDAFFFCGLECQHLALLHRIPAVLQPQVFEKPFHNGGGSRQIID